METILAITLCNLLLIGIWIWMLIDCAIYETDQDNQRLIWIIIVAVTGPIGALIYLLVRRPRRIREFRG